MTRFAESFKRQIPHVSMGYLADDDKYCPICMEEYDFLEPGIAQEFADGLKRGHTFSQVCLSEWLAGSMSCPLCREEIFAEDYNHYEMNNIDGCEEISYNGLGDQLNNRVNDLQSSDKAKKPVKQGVERFCMELQTRLEQGLTREGRTLPSIFIDDKERAKRQATLYQAIYLRKKDTYAHKTKASPKGLAQPLEELLEGCLDELLEERLDELLEERLDELLEERLEERLEEHLEATSETSSWTFSERHRHVKMVWFPPELIDYIYTHCFIRKFELSKIDLAVLKTGTPKLNLPPTILKRFLDALIAFAKVSAWFWRTRRTRDPKERIALS
ncbi:E3 ubiquitin-protein ligase hrd1 [Lecanora helva]